MAYLYRNPDGSVDLPKLQACRREVDRDPTLSSESKAEWLARFDAVEASKNSKFPGKLTAKDAGVDVEIDMLGDIGASFFSEGITAQEVADRIKGKTGTVKIRMNSGGGDAFEGVAIANLLATAPNRVEVDVIGLAASAATLVTCAADEVRMGDGALMMVHGSSTVTAGDARRLKSRLQMLEATDQSAAQTYARRTKRPVQEMQQLMAAESWFTAQQAVDAGFADKVVAGEAVQMLVDPADIPPEVAARITSKEPCKHGNMKSIALRLGLTDSATEQEVLAALDARLGPGDPEEPETEDKPVDEPPPAAAAAAEVADEQRAAIAKLHTAAVTLAVETAISNGKLTPALRDTAIAACGSSPETLRAQVALWEAMPALVARKPSPTPKPTAAAQLTPQQMRFAKMAKLTPEQWLAARNEQTETANG